MNRPIIKTCHLTQSEDAWLAVEVTRLWRKGRKLSQCLPRAILLYDALTRDDLDRFHELLRLYFPCIRIGGSNIARYTPPVAENAVIMKTNIVTLIANADDSFDDNGAFD